MKKIRFSILIILMFSYFISYSQQNFSLATKSFVNDLNGITDISGNFRLSPSFIDKYALWYDNDVYYVSGLAKINQEGVIKLLEEKGILINSKLNDIISIRVPLEKIQELPQIEGLLYVELGRKVSPLLKDAVKDTRADSVHQGILLPQAYTGKNVIIGFTDWGFDYTHPNFYDTTLTNLRIVSAWDQYKTSGPTPTNYPYGTEFSTEQDLLAAGSDTFNIYGYHTHGTHVAGIAAGSGAGTPYRGFAFDAELVFVSIKVDEASVFDAFNYIYEYAEAAAKPLVINMSWGLYYIGTLDGHSLLSQALDYLSSQGVLLVSSAGNNGDENFHLRKDFSPGDSLQSFVDFQPYSSIPTMWGQSVSMWGSPGYNFKYTAEIYSNTYVKVAELPLFNTIDNIILDTILVLSDDTIFFKIETASSNPFNQRPGVRLRVRNLETANYKIAVKVLSDSGSVHLWNLIEMTNDVGNWGTAFSNPITGTLPGDNNYAIGEPACTESVIAVASYRSQIVLPNGNPAYGNISSFSSRGPLINENVKPDIAGPGQNVGSSMSSFYTTPFTSIATVSFNNKNYKFGRLSGTSMSSPAVAGICALIREANPSLSPQSIKDLLKQTARQDNYTGLIPMTGDLLWGWGKVNAYHACRIATGMAGETDYFYSINSGNIYPNPSSGLVNFNNYESIEKLSVFNLEGKLIFKTEEISETMDFGFLEEGIYFFSLYSTQEVIWDKIVILR
ncbi:MAG: S8 family serine peptidase [Bacteroidales bacterium]|nr:S8 family serine peptidase [Bacteroidales bacterium]